jgi:putative methyltransferase (TIGR04325 family)
MKMDQSSLKSFKSTARELVVNIPLLSDYFLHYWVFPRSSASCRSVFSSFAEALSATPSMISRGYSQCYEKSGFYDVSTKERKKNMEKNIEEINEFNKSIDYPVLVWLREAFTDSSKVFDLGGNTGYGYHAYQKMIPYPSTLKWTICDLPQVVEAGQRILETTDSPGLTYTSNIADAEGSEIFITCGTLQYLEPSLGELLEKLAHKPRHLIVHNVPLCEGEEYFTHQNLMPAYVPYKIQNRGKFLASLNSLGYEIVDNWEINRVCRIPFHPERFVRAYHGFYLRRL